MYECEETRRNENTSQKTYPHNFPKCQTNHAKLILKLFCLLCPKRNKAPPTPTPSTATTFWKDCSNNKYLWNTLERIYNQVHAIRCARATRVTQIVLWLVFSNRKQLCSSHMDNKNWRDKKKAYKSQEFLMCVLINSFVNIVDFSDEIIYFRSK